MLQDHQIKPDNMRMEHALTPISDQALVQTPSYTAHELDSRPPSAGRADRDVSFLYGSDAWALANWTTQEAHDDMTARPWWLSSPEPERPTTNDDATGSLFDRWNLADSDEFDQSGDFGRQFAYAAMDIHEAARLVGVTLPTSNLDDADL